MTNGNEASAFVAGLKGVEKIGPARKAELAALVSDALASGWTVKALADRNEWPVNTPARPHLAHRRWLEDLGEAPTPAAKVAVMECPEHPGEPYDHTPKCQGRHEPEAWEWRQAQRDAHTA